LATLKPEFNERLYEFCVNYELVAEAGALIAGYAPGIPSPQDESELGWDAEVSMPSFGQTFLLQYKIARRTTAKAGANARFWDVYGSEYWRFSLHRDSDGTFVQHQLLLDAEATGVTPLYCAPLVHGRGELVAALRTGRVVGVSALIPVASLGPALGRGPHSVTYPTDETSGDPALHSDPHRGRRVSWDEVRDSRPEPRHSLEPDFFDQVSSSILERRPRRRRRERIVEAEDPRAHAFLRASAVAHDELGATLVVIPDVEA
jgi:hypothetical protein